jgi:nitroreductase
MSRCVSVSEAVERRMSVRAFRPDPVDGALVRTLLDKARRAPSGGNLQPWRVDVLMGAPLEQFRAETSAQIASGARETPQYAVYPDNLFEPYRSYRHKTGEDMYALIGVARDNKLGRMAQFIENYRFFGAPVGLFFSFDRRMGPPQWSDVGMYMQTLMLLAVEAGLDTCAQECWSQFPDTVGRFLGFDDNRLLFSGMALGRRDETNPINRLKTDRAPLKDFAVFHGFEESSN